MPLDPDKTDFAYKYPFTSEAKEIVQQQANEINVRYLDLAGRHIDNVALGNFDYTDISMNSVKIDYVMTYLYSRMLLSAIKRYDLIKMYAIGEARRS